MGEPQSIEQWREAKAAVSAQEFEQRHPHIHLVWAPLVQIRSSNGEGRVEFHTAVGTSLQHAKTIRTRSVPPEGEALITEPIILPLTKGPENPFPDRISIGRAPNCDVVIRESSVSKLHGHFREVTPVSAIFTDSKSANGTRVNGATVVAGAAVILKSLDELALGRVFLKFMAPLDLYRWL